MVTAENKDASVAVATAENKPASSRVEVPAYNPRPGQPGSKVWQRDDRTLASLMRRAVIAGQARVVTTPDGRWWLQVDRLSISADEREMVNQLAESAGAPDVR